MDEYKDGPTGHVATLSHTGILGSIMNLLNITHNLFATEEAFITQLWSTSSLVIDGPESASVMLVAAEHAGRSPWFMVKSSLVNFVRNLEPTALENEVNVPSLGFRDPANAIQFGVDKDVYQLTFKSPGPYWCFKYFASSRNYYDWHRGSGLDEQTLSRLQAFSTFVIPGELPSGIRGMVPENDGNVDHPRARSISDDSASSVSSALSEDTPCSPQTSPMIDNHSIAADSQAPPIDINSDAFDASDSESEDNLLLLYPPDVDVTLNPEQAEELGNRMMPAPASATDVEMPDDIKPFHSLVESRSPSGTSLSRRVMGFLTRLGTDIPPQSPQRYHSLAGDPTASAASVARAASSGCLKRPNAWPGSESASKRCKLS